MSTVNEGMLLLFSRDESSPPRSTFRDTFQMKRVWRDWKLDSSYRPQQPQPKLAAWARCEQQSDRANDVNMKGRTSRRRVRFATNDLTGEVSEAVFSYPSPLQFSDASSLYWNAEELSATIYDCEVLTATATNKAECVESLERAYDHPEQSTLSQERDQQTLDPLSASELRGLEIFLYPTIGDHCKETVRSILDLRNDLREEDGALLETKLSERSRALSLRSRVFAFKLAQADALEAERIARERPLTVAGLLRVLVGFIRYYLTCVAQKAVYGATCVYDRFEELSVVAYFIIRYRLLGGHKLEELIQPNLTTSAVGESH